MKEKVKETTNAQQTVESLGGIHNKIKFVVLLLWVCCVVKSIVYHSFIYKTQHYNRILSIADRFISK